MVFKDSPAIYIQIALYVCEQILLKKWKPEEKIISIRDLGELIEISPNTVQRAYDFLQQKKIITNVRGIGLFVDPDAEENILAFRREQFLENELPETLRNLYLLKIDIQQVGELYEKFVKKNFPNKKR
jgi:DNA-binding transcriptional regulator YhcF (GntR family)